MTTDTMPCPNCGVRGDYHMRSGKVIVVECKTVACRVRHYQNRSDFDVAATAAQSGCGRGDES